MYKAGTITTVHGSAIVTGQNTEFLKFVATGNMLKIPGEAGMYVIQEVISHTSLSLTTTFKGSSISGGVGYSITRDRTPNMSLPLLTLNQPDSTDILNQTLLKIDKHMGGFLDYHTLSDITYSGENGFYIKGNYNTDELKVGRSVKFIASGETQIYDVIENNAFFEATISATPLGQTVEYTSATSGEALVDSWDVIHNTRRNSYGMVDSIDTATNTLTMSGEIQGTSWGSSDAIKCYGSTKGAGYIASGITSTTLTVEGLVDGAAVNFEPAYRLYNYNRNSYRTILSSDALDLVTAESVDDWIAGDLVYTVEADVKISTMNLLTDASSIEYGAQSQIGADEVGQTHIDWGYGSNQVNALGIPVNISGISGENIKDAMEEINSKLSNHLVTGEAHTGNQVAFADDAQGPWAISSVHMQDAVNELKSAIGTAGRIIGEVTSADDETTFYSTDFVGYDPNFFNTGEWYCRFDTGINLGDLRNLDSFASGEGQFYFSGENSFSYEPEVGNVFTMFLNNAV